MSRRRGDPDMRGGYDCSLDFSSADIVSGVESVGELAFEGCGITLVSGCEICITRIAGARASFPGWPVCLISRVGLLCITLGCAGNK